MLGCSAVTYGPGKAELAFYLTDLGLSEKAISRQLGVNRATLRAWGREGAPDSRFRVGACEGRCEGGRGVPSAPYAYLLGQYLGDGCLSVSRRGVYRLRIACCSDYPMIEAEVREAIKAVMPGRSVGRIAKQGSFEVYADSKHWACLFPQHGPGKKHDREIRLDGWQHAIVDEHPKPFLRGLVHSDGCRVINRVKGNEYPRYHFTNRSDDIKTIFGHACDVLDIPWRRMNAVTLSIARRDAVAFMDTFIGPKT